MTRACIVTVHEPAGEAQRVSIAESQVSNWRHVKGQPLWMMARALKWVGHVAAGIAQIFVFSGSGPWTLVVSITGALIGSLASILAHELGLPGALKGIRVENVFTPVCLSMPNYTRVRDVPNNIRPTAKTAAWQ